MKKLFGILSLSVITFGCCSNIDCADGRAILNFSYLSQDGDDLLNGQFKKYDVTDINIYSIEPSGSKQFLNIEFKTEQGSPSVGSGVFTTLNDRWFVELTGTLTDTLDIKFKTNDGGCCGVQTWIDTLDLNGIDTSLGLYGSEILNVVERN